MWSKRITAKRIILIASATVVLSICIVVVLIYMGYPLFEKEGHLAIRPNDPFWAAVGEHDNMIDLIFNPIYPEPGPHGRYPEFAFVVQYFLNTDFTDKFNALDEIYQKAIQGDKDSKDQRKKARDFRASSLRKMKKSPEILHEGIEILQKHANQDEWDFTEDEKRKISSLTSRSVHRVYSKR